MINEEDYIRNKMGNKNPFTVPEGYFEQLTGDIMSKIPAQKEIEQQKPALIKRLRPLLLFRHPKNSWIFAFWKNQFLMRNPYA